MLVLALLLWMSQPQPPPCPVSGSGSHCALPSLCFPNDSNLPALRELRGLPLRRRERESSAHACQVCPHGYTSNAYRALCLKVLPLEPRKKCHEGVLRGNTLLEQWRISELTLRIPLADFPLAHMPIGSSRPCQEPLHTVCNGYKSLPSVSGTRKQI